MNEQPADGLSVNQEKKLADLVVGDLVIWSGSYGRGRAVRKIEKVTATKIVVGESRYRRDCGSECGSEVFGRCRIAVPRPGEIEKVRKECRNANICARLEMTKWRDLPLETLEAVWAIVGPKDPAAQPAKNTEGAAE